MSSEAAVLVGTFNAPAAARAAAAIAAGAKVKAKNLYLTAPPSLASNIAGGHLKDVRDFIGRGGSPNATFCSGKQLLFVAAVTNQLSIVRELVRSGADVHARTPDGSATALLGAASKGHHAVVKFLVAAGSGVDVPVMNGATPLFTASGSGHLQVIKQLIDGGANANLSTNAGATPLIVAVQLRLMKVVNLLLESGADVEQCQQGVSPLLFASFAGDKAIVRRLLASGADANRPAASGETPLYVAAKNGKQDVLKLLLAGGAKVDLATPKGTPLFVAMEESRGECTAALIKAGASIDVAATFGSSPMLQKLLKSGLGKAGRKRPAVASGAGSKKKRAKGAAEQEEVEGEEDDAAAIDRLLELATVARSLEVEESDGYGSDSTDGMESANPPSLPASPLGTPNEDLVPGKNSLAVGLKRPSVAALTVPGAISVVG